MLKQYNMILRPLAGFVQRRKQIDERLEALCDELKELERKSDALRRKCGQKQDEYGSIEFGWKAIVYGLRGRRKSEMEQARIAIEEFEHQMKITDDKTGCVRREMEALKAEKEQIAPYVREYKRVFRLKRETMTRHGLFSLQILQMEEKMRMAGEEEKRLKSLWETGDEIMDQLRCISNHLNSAENASQSDMRGGGSIYSGYRKHGHLSDAQKEYAALQKMIEQFGRQMNGEGARIGDMSIELNRFSVEMDVIFDNMLTDWKVLQHVRATKEEFMKVYDQMRIVMKSLAQQRRALEELKKRLREEVDGLILASE